MPPVPALPPFILLVTMPKQLDEYAWYKGNSKNVYHKVGAKAPNAWGLYDMLGNVAEWTLDQYDEAYFTKLKDGAS